MKTTHHKQTNAKAPKGVILSLRKVSVVLLALALFLVAQASLPVSANAALTVVNLGASNVTASSATLYGQLAVTNGNGLIVTNTCTVSNLTSGAVLIGTNTAAQFGVFSIPFSGLSNDAVYSAVFGSGDASNGWSYSAITNFVTWAGTPGQVITNLNLFGWQAPVIINTNTGAVWIELPNGSSITIGGSPIGGGSETLSNALMLGNVAPTGVVMSVKDAWSSHHLVFSNATDSVELYSVSNQAYIADRNIATGVITTNLVITTGNGGVTNGYNRVWEVSTIAYLTGVVQKSYLPGDSIDLQAGSYTNISGNLSFTGVSIYGHGIGLSALVFTDSGAGAGLTLSNFVMRGLELDGPSVATLVSAYGHFEARENGFFGSTTDVFLPHAIASEPGNSNSFCDNVISGAGSDAISFGRDTNVTSITGNDYFRVVVPGGVNNGAFVRAAANNELWITGNRIHDYYTNSPSSTGGLIVGKGGSSGIPAIVHVSGNVVSSLATNNPALVFCNMPTPTATATDAWYIGYNDLSPNYTNIVATGFQYTAGQTINIATNEYASIANGNTNWWYLGSSNYGTGSWP